MAELCKTDATKRKEVVQLNEQTGTLEVAGR
jgi:hypothetical protein